MTNCRLCAVKLNWVNISADGFDFCANCYRKLMNFAEKRYINELLKEYKKMQVKEYD